LKNSGEWEALTTLAMGSLPTRSPGSPVPARARKIKSYWMKRDRKAMPQTITVRRATSKNSCDEDMGLSCKLDSLSNR
jgi:hypothetical protein